MNKHDQHFHAYIKAGLFLLLLSIIGYSTKAQQTGALTENIIVEQSTGGNAFPVVSEKGATSIFYDSADHKGVVRAIGDLKKDIASVANAIYQEVNDQQQPLAHLISAAHWNGKNWNFLTVV